MDKNKLKEIIREIVDKVLAENAPAPAKPKEKEKEEPVVAPSKPGEKEPERRRRDLRPDKDNLPKVAPKAVKLKEEEMLNKIVARFKSKKLDEGSSKVDLTAKNQDEISALSSEQKKKLYDELTDAATEVNDKDFKTKAEYAKAMKDAKIKVYKKYIKL